MVPMLSSFISLIRSPTSFPIFSSVHLHLPRPLDFLFIGRAVLGRQLQEPARREQQQAGGQRPQQSNVQSFGMVLGKLLLQEGVWLGLPRGADSTPDLLGPATSPWWVAPRNNSLSLSPTWDQEALGICSCPS